MTYRAATVVKGKAVLGLIRLVGARLISREVMGGARRAFHMSGLTWCPRNLMTKQCMSFVTTPSFRLSVD